MSIKRYPQLAHWGAYTAVVEDGRLIRCEPFVDDPDPSPLLDSIVPMVYSDKRIRKPAVRRSWLQKREGSDRTLRGREDFVEVDWELALDLVAQENRRVRERYGASGLLPALMAGRRPGGCTMPARWCGDSISAAAAGSISRATTAGAQRSSFCRM
ncbi:hypothetical protein AK51_06940 [Serratia nematodiphila DZ0503SBS1]|nr:hypothetical protein AK51_06940 [Serratia nematodiphila DZ0503SBS1]